MNAAAPMVGWSAVTFACYAAALLLYRRSGHRLMCLPVLTGTALLLAVLALARVDYPTYAAATHPLRWMTGPAIIALAVPLYRQLPLLRRWALPLLAALLVGCLSSLLGTLAVAWLAGAPDAVALSLAPKAATMPLAMLAVERAGGIPAIAAMAVVATGVLGPVLAGPVLRWLRIDDPAVQAFALGLVAHAIGVARVLQTQPDRVAFAALAMGLNGVATAFALAWLARWW